MLGAITFHEKNSSMLADDNPGKVGTHSNVIGDSATLRLDPVERLAGLDGLRALAVAAVVLFHADFAWARGGYLGVDLFFVISGFLITSLMAREIESTGRLALGAFYWRRAKRLLPASLLMTAMVVVVASWVAPDAMHHLRRDVVASLAYVTNWELLRSETSYFEAIGRPPLLQHLWSLAIEEQFYLAWAPLSLFLMPRLGRRRMTAVAVALATTSAGAMGALAIGMDYRSQTDASRLYFGTDTHGFTLLLGAALGLRWQPSRRAVPATFIVRGFSWLAGLSALTIMVLLFARMGENHALLYPWGFLITAFAGMILIVVATHPGVSFGRTLDAGPMRWVGTRSYGIYLWHWPVFMLTRPEADLHGFDNDAVFVLRMLVTVILAEGSYRFLEMPVRQGFLDRLFTVARRRAWPARLSVVSIVSATAFAIGTILWEAPLEATPAPDVREALELAIPPQRPSTARGPALAVAPVVAIDVASPPIAPARAMAVASATAAIPEEPEGPMYAGTEITVVGDSVMLGSKRILTSLLPGTDLYATMGWQAADVLRQVQSLKKSQALRPVVVVHLGTNGYITEQQLRQILGLLSACKRVVLVNTRVPRRWMASNNELIDQVAPEFPNVRVARWSDISARKPEYFISDRVHLTAIGQRALLADVMRVGHLGHRQPTPPSSDNDGVKSIVKDSMLPERLPTKHATRGDTFWLNVAQCETRSDWHEYTRSLGGLNIGLGAWSAWGGDAFAPTPSEATREQQILVATRISTQGWTNDAGELVKAIGFDHWKCAAMLEPPEGRPSTHGRDES